MSDNHSWFHLIILWLYTAFLFLFTSVVEYANLIEPDKLVWILGFAGSFFGAAMFPSAQVWRTVVKLIFGCIVAGVFATPVANSHYFPVFFNVHGAALLAGFSGPAFFMATYETKFLSLLKKAKT